MTIILEDLSKIYGVTWISNQQDGTMDIGLPHGEQKNIPISTIRSILQ